MIDLSIKSKWTGIRDEAKNADASAAYLKFVSIYPNKPRILRMVNARKRSKWFQADLQHPPSGILIQDSYFKSNLIRVIEGSVAFTF